MPVGFHANDIIGLNNELSRFEFPPVVYDI